MTSRPIPPGKRRSLRLTLIALIIAGVCANIYFWTGFIVHRDMTSLLARQTSAWQAYQHCLHTVPRDTTPKAACAREADDTEAVQRQRDAFCSRWLTRLYLGEE